MGKRPCTCSCYMSGRATAELFCAYDKPYIREEYSVFDSKNKLVNISWKQVDDFGIHRKNQQKINSLISKGEALESVSLPVNQKGLGE